MNNLLRVISAIIVLTAAIIIGFTCGKRSGKSESQTILIDNYAFIREIAELGTLEVNGITTFKSTNVEEGDDSWSAALKKMLLEKTVQIQAPFTAKYGVDLNDSSLQIKKNGDVIEVHLPKPKLLSYELRLDRVQTSNQKGWLLFDDENMYTAFQKKMYQQNRAQLETNALYLNQAQDRVCGIIQHYFNPLKIKTVCMFDHINAVQVKKD